MPVEADVEKVLEELGIDTSWVDDRQEAWSPCPLPFGNHKHGDKRPSFSVNMETGLYNCFVCGGGSLIDLVANVKSLSYYEAKDWIDALSRGEYVSDEDFIESVLLRLEKKKRVIRQAPYTVKPHEIEPEWEEGNLHPWMAEQGISPETAKKMGITWHPGHDGIIFPHYWKGKLVGAQMRDLTGLSKAKYKNTPEFPKKNTLYNLHNVEGDEVIVFESPKTVAVMDSRGYPNCVATFGAEITDAQIVPLWRFKRVYLWFDNDAAGRKALEKVTSSLVDHTDVYIIPFVSKEKGDAADIEAEEVSSYLDRAESYIQWKIRNKNAKF